MTENMGLGFRHRQVLVLDAPVPLSQHCQSLGLTTQANPPAQSSAGNVLRSGLLEKKGNCKVGDSQRICTKGGDGIEGGPEATLL